MRLASAAVGAALALPGLAGAQGLGSIGFTAARARFADGTSLTSAAFAPSLELGTPRAALTLGGTVATLATAELLTQAGGDLWLTAPLAGRLRVGVQASGSGVSRPGSRTAALHGMADLLYDGGSWGVAAGAGTSAGLITGAPGVTTARLRARAWHTAGPVSLALTVAPVRWFGSWFADATVSAQAAHGMVRGGASLTRRGGPAAVPSVGGAAHMQVFLRPTFALEVSGGHALRDPWQGLPRIAYASLGMRLYRPLGAAPVLAPRAARAPAPVPLLVTRVGDSATVRFHMPGARSVSIAGSWSGWRVQPLAAAGGATFGGVLRLAAGRYRFNLLVDGEWVVPAAVAVETEANGGLVAILIVR